jgi:hypothetical protein
MFVIPSKDLKRFSQPNLGDTQGNLWSSFQLDTTTNLGAIKPMRSVRVLDGEVYEQSSGQSLSVPMAYTWFDLNSAGTKDFIVYAGGILTATNPTAAYTVDARTNHPTLTTSTGNGDMKVFNGSLYVTTATELKYIGSGGTTWTSISSPAIGDGIHQMEVYGNRLYMVATSGTKIFSMDTSNVLYNIGTSTINNSTVKNGSTISWIKASSNRIWVGYTSNVGGRGYIAEWDGNTENNYSAIYPIEAQGSAGCTIWNKIPYVLDVEGRLLAFNGSNFQEVARLPFIIDEGYPDTLTSLEGRKLIHFNGIIYTNDRILFNLDSSITRNGDSTALNIPSGVWEYTKENGLIHLVSSSMNDYGDSSVKDYGQFRNSIAGAMYDASPVDASLPVLKCNFVFGSRSINDDLTTNITGVFADDVNDTLPRKLHIVTPWLESTQITDAWNKIVLKYNRLYNSSSLIDIKYRTVKSEPFTTSATWTSQTGFTVNDADFANAEVGDEITVLNNYGAGDTAHIIAITNTGGNNYTVTLDRAIAAVSNGNTGSIAVDKWIKIREHTGGGQEQFIESIPTNNNRDIRCQFKITATLHASDELYEIMVINDKDQIAK